jgi:hypothetical protein
MQKIETYDVDASHLRLLLQGPSGSGKTTTACQFPGAYVADLDINLGGPLRWLKKNNRPTPIGYDVIDRDETGKEVAPNMRYLRLTKCLQEAAANPDVKTIVIDSATKLHDYIQAEVLRQQNAQQMTIQHWGFYLGLWKQFVVGISAQKKHFVLVCHERVEKDEISQALQYFVMIPGQMGHMIGALFTDVWRSEVQEVPGVPQSTYKFVLRTMPSYRFNLKNSLGLPPTFEFNWELIDQKLKGQ